MNEYCVCYEAPTLSSLTTSGGKAVRAELETRRYMRSTKMPARMAWATERNLGFSSLLRRLVAIWRVKVDASHSRTSGGTASGCTSDSSSSSSARRLFEEQPEWFGVGVGVEKRIIC